MFSFNSYTSHLTADGQTNETYRKTSLWRTLKGRLRINRWQWHIWNLWIATIVCKTRNLTVCIVTRPCRVAATTTDNIILKDVSTRRRNITKCWSWAERTMEASRRKKPRVCWLLYWRRDQPRQSPQARRLSAVNLLQPPVTYRDIDHHASSNSRRSRRCRGNRCRWQWASVGRQDVLMLDGRIVQLPARADHCSSCATRFRQTKIYPVATSMYILHHATIASRAERLKVSSVANARRLFLHVLMASRSVACHSVLRRSSLRLGSRSVEIIRH